MRFLVMCRVEQDLHPEPEAYSEICQTSKMELFAKKVNG